VATNLQIDDKLLNKALKVGGQRTKKATVTQALEEYIRRREQLKIENVLGTIDIDPSYDYKAQRKRR